MHVAIVGAGALGAVYGAYVQRRTQASVTFVVRSTHVHRRDPIVVERVRYTHKWSRGEAREIIEHPTLVDRVPPDADVVVLAVGTDDLEAIRPLLEGTSTPIVVLTPMMPQDDRRMREAFGTRVLAAMPSVVSYRRDDGVFRHWLLPFPTRIDEPRAGDSEVVRALARSFTAAGIPTVFELGVHEANPATTVSFIPLAMLVAAAGGLHALREDDALVELAVRACREGTALGRRIGAPVPGAGLAAIAAHRTSLRAFEAAGRALCPEVLHYVDVHFGRKLVAQHRRMIASMIELARERELPHAALEEVARRLANSASNASGTSGTNIR